MSVPWWYLCRSEKRLCLNSIWASNFQTFLGYSLDNISLLGSRPLTSKPQILNWVFCLSFCLCLIISFTTIKTKKNLKVVRGAFYCKNHFANDIEMQHYWKKYKKVVWDVLHYNHDWNKLFHLSVCNTFVYYY